MTELPATERELLAGADRRVPRLILLLAIAGTGISAWRWGRELGVSFAVGGGLAYVNYRWIVAVVDALVQSQQVRPTRRTYLKLFAPLVLLAVALYVIFTARLLSPVGVLGGLSVLVAAILMESLYQLFLTGRR